MAESSMELLDLSVTIDGKEIKLKVSRDIYQKAIQEDQATLDLICASVGETTSKQEYSQDLSDVGNQKDGQARGNKEKVCACKGIRTCVLCESIGKESVVPVKLSKVLVDEQYEDDSTFQQLNGVDDDGDIYIATHQPAGEFDFNQGMARLEMAAEQGLESLKTAVLSENLLLSNHELDDLPEELPLDIASMKDDIAAYLLEKYNDIQYGTPIKTTADGDCLFNAVSILLFGDESKALELRYRTLIVMINDVDSLLDLADTSSIMLLSPDINEAILECAKLGGFSSIWTMIALSKLIDRPIQSIYPYVNGKEDLAYKILNQTFNKEAEGYKLPIMWSTTNLPKDVGSNKKTWVPNHFVAVLPSCQESHVIDDAEFVPKYSKSTSASNPDKVTEGLEDIPLENGSKSDGIKSEVNPDALNDVEPMDIEIDLMSGVKRASAEGPCRGKLDKFFNLKQLLDVFKLEGTGLPSVPRGIKENMFFVVDNTLNVDDMKFRSHCEFTDDCGEWEKGSCPSTYLLPVEDSNEYVTLRKKEGKFGVELGKGGFQEIQPQPCYGDLLVISRYYKRLKTSSSYRRRVAWVANVPDSVLDINPKVAVYEYMGDVPYQLLHNNRKTADKDKPNTKKKPSELQNKVIDNADGEPNIDSAREIIDEEQSEKESSEVCDSSSVNNNIHCVTVDAPCRGKLNKFLGMKQLLDVFKCHKTGLPTVPRGVKDNMYFVVNTTKKLERFQKSERFMYNDDCGSWGKGTSPTAYLLPSEGPEEYERLTKRNHIFCIEMPNKEYMEVKPQPKLEDLIIVSRYYSKLKADSTYRRRISCLVNVPESMSADYPLNVAVYEYMGEYPRYLIQSNPKNTNKKKQSSKKKLKNKVSNNEPSSDSTTECNDNDLIKGETIEPYNSESVRDLARMSVEGPCRGKLDKFFLSINNMMYLFKQERTGLASVPPGAKDNIYFIIDNSLNVEKYKKGEKCQFWDDCGAWEKSSSPTTYLIPVDGSSEYVSIVKRRGKFCMAKSHSEFEEIQPQPDLEDLLIINRYYTKLKADNSYRRRISWIVNLPNTDPDEFAHVALYEYKGNFPCRLLHGNTKRSDKNLPYIKTDPTVHQKIVESVKNQSAKNVYEDLNKESNVHRVPRNLKQVQNLKYTENKKLRTNVKLGRNSQTLADNIMPTIMKLYVGHEFVRSIKQVTTGPSIILYTDQQINDMRRFCCCDQPAILYVDKTYNLGEMFLTTTLFKNLSLVRATTDVHPVLLGPAYIHGKSDFSTFNEFFGHLGSHFTDEEMSKMIIGSDNESALKQSVMRCFPCATHIVCSQHLKNSIRDYLNKRVEVTEEDKSDIMDLLFGDGGLREEKNPELFKSRVDEIASLFDEKVPGFDKYFKRNIAPVLKKQAIDIPDRARQLDTDDWTENNSEFMYELLLIGTDHMMEDLTDIIDLIYRIVKSMYESWQNAIIGSGDYELAPSFKHQEISPDIWSQKTPEQKENTLKRFSKDTGLSLSKKLPQRKWLVAKSPCGRKRVKISI